MYNYYYLAVQNWCSVEYLIHGLWADINSTSYPSFCTDSAFDLTELQKSTQYENILDAWYDCSYEDTISLYEHEWSKHGTCIALQLGITQNEYFEKTVSLYETYKDGANDICFDLDFNVIPCK
jgi:ribonuclease T2